MRKIKCAGFFFLWYFTMWSTGFSQTIKPNQIPGLTLWLRADSAVVLNGSSVESWNDCSGNNNSAMQADNSMQPAFIDSVSSIDNKPAIRFDGINDFMAFSEITTIRTCFFVCKHATGYGDYNITLGHSSSYHFAGGTGNLLFSSGYASQDIIQGSIFENGIGLSPTTITKPTKYSIISLITTGNVAASNIGSDRGIPNQFWNGDFVEIIIYGGDLNNSDRSTVEKYLQQKYAPPVSLGPDIIIPYGFCNIPLDAGSRFTHFIWSTGDTTKTISVGASGTYSVTATDYFGYLTSDTINVIFPHIALYDTVFCAGSNVVLSTGLAGNYGYLWSNGLTTPTIAVNSPGVFSVTVTDSLSCFKESLPVYVGEDNFYSTVSLGGDTTLCSGELIGLVSPNPLPPGLIYLWSTGATTPQIPVTTSGDYSVTVTNVNGCIAIDTVFVTIAGIIPNVDFSYNTACSGLASQFYNTSTPGGTSWLWNFGDGQTSTLENPSHVYATGGDYNVSLLCSDGGCINVISKTIHIPYSPTAAFTVSQTCINIPYSFIDQSSVSEGNIVMWEWDFGDGSPHSFLQHPQHIYSSSGTYAVALTVMTDSNCMDSIQHQIEVIGTAPAPSAFILYQPVNNFMTNDHVITFSWNSSSGAVSYTLEYSPDSLFINSVTSIPGILLNSVVQNIVISQKYYWRVIAYNLCGDTTVSNIFSFSFFSPSIIGGMQLWLMADSNVVLNGNNVVQWNDCSGNNNQAVQPDPAFQPIYVSSETAINDMPAIHFDGVDDYLSFNDLSNIRTCFFVFKHQTGSSVSYEITLGHSTYYDFHGGDGTALFSNLFTSPQVLNGNAYVNGVVNSPSLLTKPSSYELLSLETTDNCHAQYIARDRSQSVFWHGDFAELIIYDHQLTNNDRIMIQNYLNFKYFPNQNCPVLQVNLGPDIWSNNFCPDTLYAGEQFEHYQWSTGNPADTMSRLIVSMGGTYSVTVTDYCGFTSTDEISIYKPVIQMHDTIFCSGGNVIISANLTGDYTYNWSNGTNTPTDTISQVGNYWSTITDIYSCSVISDTILVSIDTFPIIGSLGIDTSICSGELIGLVSPNPLPSGLTYLWSTNDTTSEVPVTATGDYSVTVTNFNGCIAIDTVHVAIAGMVPNVNFSFNIACSGLATQFYNASTPAGTSWLWNFGDGQTSTLENPSHVYSTGGDYSVGLLCSDGSCSNVISKTIHIPYSPTAAFTVSQTCIYIPYSFIDQSSVSEGNIVMWEWDFGDGSPHSFLQHPQHTYSSSGTYAVTLTVTTDSNCIGSTQHQIEVIGSAPIPSAFLLYLPVNNFLTTDHSITFAWNSALGAVSYTLEYSPDSLFINSVTSIPDIFSNSVGQNIGISQKYYWRVIAYNLCGDSTVSNIFSFSFFSPNIIGGMQLWLMADSNVVLNGNNVVQWNDCSGNNNHAIQADISMQPAFIDSVSGIDNKPAIRFDGINDFIAFNEITTIRTCFFVCKHATGYGDYNITLGHSSSYHFAGGTGDLLFSSGYASQDILQGSIFKNSIGLSPLTITKPTKYSIISVITTGNVAAINIGSDRGIPNQFWNGDFVEIIICDGALNNSDRNTVEKYLQQKYAGPPVSLGPDINVPYGFCGTLLDAGSRFTHFLWSTGDTTQTFGPTQSGTYSVTATDIFGFLSTDTVQVIMPSLTVFQDTTVCLGDTLHFSVNLGNDYTYLWLPDSITTSTFTITQPGNYSLTVFDTMGCQRTQTFTVAVDSFPVQASLGPDRNICQGDYITLASGAQQAVSYLWSDNSGNSYLPINGAPGTTPAYSVTVTNANGCLAVDTILLNINGVMPAVAFSNDSVCEGSATHFTDLSSVIPPYTIASRLWDFGDSTASTAQNPVHVYAEDGIYQAVLTVVTDSGCTRTFQKDVKVFSMPAVNFLPYEGCSGVAVNFSDITECPYGNVNLWQWTFGDSYGAGNDTSSQANPQYTYDSAGTFTVSLIAASVAGCVDSAAHTITIKKSPEVAFSNTPACAGNLVYFTNETIIPPWETITHYEWQFGDGTVSAVSNPSHIFDTAGTYDVTLTVRSLSGCEVSATIPVVIGAIPAAAFSYTGNCIHITSQFSDSSTSTQGVVNQWEWDFGGLGTSSLQNSGFMFPDTGNYVVSLTVATDHGCADSTSATIRVYPLPVAAFDLDPEYGIPPLPVSFTNLSVGAGHFLWAFGDGDTDTVAEPVHTFLLQGIYPVLLTAYSANGCYDTVSHNAYVLPTSVDIAVRNATLTLQDNRLTVAADLLNVGSRKIEHIDIAMQMENGSIIHEQWYGALMQGEFVHYVFNAQPDLPAGQQVDFVCITASLLPELEEVILENNRNCPVLESNFSLSEPYPNPVAGNVVIGYVLPFSGEVSIELYNEMGEKVTVLFTGERSEGYNTHTFDMSALVGGVYALKVIFHDNALRKKFVKM